MFLSSSHRPSFSHLSIALILVHDTSIVHPSVVHHLIHFSSLFKFLWPRHYPSCLSLWSRCHPIVHHLVDYPLLLSLFTYFHCPSICCPSFDPSPILIQVLMASPLSIVAYVLTLNSVLAILPLFICCPFPGLSSSFLVSIVIPHPWPYVLTVIHRS